MNDKILSINNLNVKFKTGRKKYYSAVDGVTFDVERGKTVCLVGESGSGKSVTSLSAMRLLKNGKNVEISGEILLNGENLMKKSDREMQGILGNNISMIFQEPSAAINPVFTVGNQIAETIIRHQKKTKKEANEMAVELLRQVGIPSPEERAKCYPHQLSGGMLQRVMIAMALSCNLELLIADEPTTALDVTIQAQIIRLMNKLKEEKKMTILLITHDMGIVAEMADYVVVMYLGQIVEKAPGTELFKAPLHPYTNGLLRCIPILGQHEKLYTIPQGDYDSSKGKHCKFSSRCEKACDRCKNEEPPAFSLGEEHYVKCWLYENAERGNDNAIVEKSSVERQKS